MSPAAKTLGPWIGVAFVAASCVGSIKGPADAPPTLGCPTCIAQSALRRLSTDEYDNTLQDLLGDTSHSSALTLPATQYDPFDNDYTTQYPSQALIEGAEALAVAASGRLLADPALRDSVVGCVPTGPDDTACLSGFITRLGRRTLRRSLTPDEVQAYLAFDAAAVADGDFYVAVDLVIRAMLQQPRFLYRVEVGLPVDGNPAVLQLDGPEVAARLSYFLWGSTPSDALLDAAESGQLSSAAQVKAATAGLLTDPHARYQVSRFHALWLGYNSLPFSPTLSTEMRTESDALVQKVIFDESGAWQDIFRSTSSFLNDDLATHYGLPAPGSATPKWVSYGTSGRQGILSHGSFLSNGAEFGDTSPTLRGLAIRRRLLCKDVPPPPPGVNVDQPPAASGQAVCKVDRYKAHSQGGCAGCHQYMDPVGFGLENYDASGAYRAHDANNTSCTITGQGTLAGVGDFQGPAQLEDLLVQSGDLNACAVTQVFRFAMGHSQLDGPENQIIGDLTSQVGTGDFAFQDLVQDLVTADAFRFVRNPVR